MAATFFLYASAIALAILVALPIIPLLYGSVWSGEPGAPGNLTLDHYFKAFSSRIAFSLFSNTLIYALGSAIFSIAFGTLLAWIVNRTNTPFRKAFYVIPIIPMMMPSMLDNIAWILLFSDRIGLVNLFFTNYLGFKEPLFNIHSMAGMVWCFGFSGITQVFLLTSVSFRLMDASLEEAATTSGSNPLSVMARITVPLVSPAIFSVFILRFVQGIESFETPVLIGIPADIPVFMSAIYESINVRVPPNYGYGTALASVILLITIVLVVIYRRFTATASRFVVVTGKGYRPRIVDLGRWKYLMLGILLTYLFTAIVLPAVTVFWLSLVPFWNPRYLSNISVENYVNSWQYSVVPAGFVNSFVVSGLSATLGLLLVTNLAYIATKTRIRGRGTLESLAMFPISMPGLILGVGLLWAFIATPGLSFVYGTVWALVIAYIIRETPFGFRTATATFIQVHSELEEASRVAGASWATTFRKIIFGLLKPSLLSVWLYFFINNFRELGAAVILSGPGNKLISVAIFEFYQGGDWARLAATSMMMMAVLVSAILLGRFVFKAELRF